MAASIPPPQKRQRKTTFSPGEINVLGEEVESNLELLNSKFTNVVTNNKKTEVWRQITAKVNAVGTAQRTVEEVRNKWRNMCREAKSKFVEHKRIRTGTGGGPAPPPLSEYDVHVLDLHSECASFNGICGGLEVGLALTQEDAVPTSQEETWDRALRRATEAAESGIENVLSGPAGDAPCSPAPPSAVIPMIPDEETGSNGQIKILPTSTRPKRKKITTQDITNLQYEVLQKESQKLDLQIQLLKKLNNSSVANLSASEIISSFS